MAVSSSKSVKSVSHHIVKEVKSKKNKGSVEKDATGYAQSGSPTLSRAAVTKPQVYTTVDGGRIHFGVDENYAGSIDSYNNFVTKFFANLFGWSANVEINGKTRSVNKSDYVKWLNSNTAYNNVTSSNVKAYLDFHTLEIKALGGQGRMRDHLSADKTRKLFEKMTIALAVNKDYDAAKKYAGKGANVDNFFWIREGLPLSLTTLTEDLPDDKAIEFRAGRYTPLLFAAEKNNKAFTDFLLTLDASPFAQGEYVLFTKKILDVNPVTTMVKSEEFKSNDGRLLTRVTLKTATELNIEDQITPKVEFTFHPETGSLKKAESKSPVVLERYTKNLERFTTRYL